MTIPSWINSTKHMDKILVIRACEDKKQQDILKKQLPAATMTGVFSQRGAEYLTLPSGFMGFDLDGKDNPDLDMEEAKEYIINVMGATYCASSATNTGLWGLYRIPMLNSVHYAEDYAGYYRMLCKVFENCKECKMILDPSCKDVSRLRFYSYDENARYSPDGIVFEYKDEIKKPIARRTQSRSGTRKHSEDKVRQCILIIERCRIDITKTYTDWWAAGCAIASEFGEYGRGFFHQVSQFHSEYDPERTDEKYDECLKTNNIGIATLFFMFECANVLYKKKANALSMENDKLCRMAVKNPYILELVDRFDLVSSRDEKPFDLTNCIS